MFHNLQLQPFSELLAEQVACDFDEIKVCTIHNALHIKQSLLLLVQRVFSLGSTWMQSLNK